MRAITKIMVNNFDGSKLQVFQYYPDIFSLFHCGVSVYID